jgi:hypothetical protein
VIAETKQEAQKIIEDLKDKSIPLSKLEKEGTNLSTRGSEYVNPLL